MCRATSARRPTSFSRKIMYQLMIAKDGLAECPTAAALGRRFSHFSRVGNMATLRFHLAISQLACSRWLSYRLLFARNINDNRTRELQLDVESSKMVYWPRLILSTSGRRRDRAKTTRRKSSVTRPSMECLPLQSQFKVLQDHMNFRRREISITSSSTTQFISRKSID